MKTARFILALMLLQISAANVALSNANEASTFEQEVGDLAPIEGIEDSPEQQRINAANWKAYLEEEDRRRAQGIVEKPGEDHSFPAFVEERRRLAEDQELTPRPHDEHEAATTNEESDEEEAVEDAPIIPGLSGVDLFAFNAEYANGEVLEKIIDWSYDRTAAASPYRDNFIHVNDLYAFLLNTLNPLKDAIDDEDHEILTDAVLELRKAQGLVDDDMIVHRGFIARGMPLRFLQSLAHKMHQTVQSRRLQASDSHQEL